MSKNLLTLWALSLSGTLYCANAVINYNKNILTKGGVTLTPPLSGSLLQTLSIPTLAGYLDQTFGGGTTNAPRGTQFVNFSISGQLIGNVFDQINAIALQPDGKIVVAGTSQNNGGNPNYFALARFLPSGQLDTSFGQIGTSRAGTQYVPFSISDQTIGNTNDVASAVLIQPDGRIILCGVTNIPGGTAHPAVACFLPNGQLDTTFGQINTTRAGTNYVTFGISNTVAGDGIAGAILQSDEKIVLVGSTSNGGAPFYTAIVRFLANGILDTTFGQVNTARAGTAYIPFSLSGQTNTAQIFDFGTSIAVTSTGSLVTIVSTNDGTNTYIGIAQFTSSGILDTTFGARGTSRAGTNYIPFTISNTATPFSDGPANNAIALQSDGKILTTGSSNNRFSLARFLSTGTLDTEFGQIGTPRAGTQYINFSISGQGIPIGDQPICLALQPNGKIILGGYSSPNFANPIYCAFARFESNGQLDPSFGVNSASGMKSVTPGTCYLNLSISGQNAAKNDSANSMIIQSNGQIVAAGTSGNNNNTASPLYFAISRLTNPLTQAYYQSEYPSQGGFY